MIGEEGNRGVTLFCRIMMLGGFITLTIKDELFFKAKF